MTFTDEEHNLIQYMLGHCGLGQKVELTIPAKRLFAVADSLAVKIVEAGNPDRNQSGPGGFGWSPLCDSPSDFPCACGATHTVVK